MTRLELPIPADIWGMVPAEARSHILPFLEEGSRMRAAEAARKAQHNSNIRKFNDQCRQKRAVNLAQGLCHVECTREKREAVEKLKESAEAGCDKPFFDTYSSYLGDEELRRLIAVKAREFNKLDVDPARNVIVTPGCLSAFSSAIDAVTRPLDEVILFQPVYSFHTAQLVRKFVFPKSVSLRPPNWTFTRDDLEAVYTPRTRAIVINTPSNPSGKVFDRGDLETIASFCIERDLVAITDEVYEFMTYGSNGHISLATLPGMWERTITLSSFGKLLSITGYRVGYAVAPHGYIYDMGITNEAINACANTTAQHAIVAGFRDLAPFMRHREVFRRKRDILCDALETAGIPIYRPEGSVYVLADVSELARRWGLPDSEAVNLRLMDDPGIGGVPAVDFYDDDSGKRLVRYCFAVRDEVLYQAADRLSSLRVS